MKSGTPAPARLLRRNSSQEMDPDAMKVEDLRGGAGDSGQRVYG